MNKYTPLSKRQQLEQKRLQLDIERQTFKPHWSDLSQYIAPRRYRAFVSDANKGDKRNQKIINSAATLAARTLRSGMMSGITSPARPWFKLTTQEPNAYESGPVRQWLQVVTQRMSGVFLKSNLYNVLPIVYGDMGIFGTGCFYVEEDFDGDVIRCFPFPIGSYYLSSNEKLQVDTFYREFQMTVRQVIEKFATDKEGNINFSKVSQHCENLYKTGLTETWLYIVHCIIPNENYDPNKTSVEFKKYSSYYYEQGISGVMQNYFGSGQVEEKFLSVGGYDVFPILAGRWEVSGEDVYSTSCPGMEALGDIKALQIGEKKTAQAVEKIINPPMQGPTKLKGQKSSLLPGDITYLDSSDGQSSFRPVHEVRFDIQPMELKIRQTEQRISRAFYEDLFLMLAQSDRRQITAREIDERHEEKLLALGPVLEQLNQDILDPLIDITFNIMLNQGLIPPAPEELQGKPLKVEYVSILAQAQKLVSIGGIDRFAGFFGNLLQAEPEVKDKVDFDQLTDIYGEITSIPEGIIRSDEDVSIIRQQRNQMIMRQQQLQEAQAMAMTAKQLSDTKVEGDSALTRIVGANGAV